MEKICVAVRVRPAVDDEGSNGSGTFWKVEDNRISLHRALGTPISGLAYAFGNFFGCGSHIGNLFVGLYFVIFGMNDYFDFEFADHVFDGGCTNSTVYELLTKDIIHAAVEGFNGDFSILFGKFLEFSFN